MSRAYKKRKQSIRDITEPLLDEEIIVSPFAVRGRVKREKRQSVREIKESYMKKTGLHRLVGLRRSSHGTKGS